MGVPSHLLLENPMFRHKWLWTLILTLGFLSQCEPGTCLGGIFGSLIFLGILVGIGSFFGPIGSIVGFAVFFAFMIDEGCSQIFAPDVCGYGQVQTEHQTQVTVAGYPTPATEPRTTDLSCR